MIERRRDMRFAEWVLSLAMPLDRAQAMLGDMEEDPCGPLQFWLRILRMVAAFTGHGVVQNGFRIALWSAVWWSVSATILVNFWLLRFRIGHGWNLPPHTSFFSLIGVAWHDRHSDLRMLWLLWALLAGIKSWGRPLVILTVAGSVWIALSFLTDVPTEGVNPMVLYLLFLSIQTLRARAGEPDLKPKTL
ncbi:MAG: hypothetical protein ABI824_12545 [Acidobacteriota bacterium]